MENQNAEFKKVPRRGMSEANCRRFEKKIAEACFGSVTVDPGTEELSAKSYIVYWSEARRGFEVYKYPSRFIPQGYWMRNIKPYELENGMVLLENKVEDRNKALKQAADQSTTINWSNKDVIEGIIEKVLQDRKNDEPIYIKCNNESQLNVAWPTIQERLKSLSPHVTVFPKREEMVVVIN